MDTTQYAGRWVRFLDANRGRVLGACALVAAVGAVGTVLLYSDLRPDMRELLPRTAPSVRDLDDVSRRVGGWGEESVVVYGAELPVLERFADALHERLLEEPVTTIRHVEYRIDDLARFYEPRKWFVPDLAQLEKVRDRLKERIHWEKVRASPMFVALDDDPAPGFEDLAKDFDGQGGDMVRFPSGYYEGTAELDRAGVKEPMLVMLVRMGGAPDDYASVQRTDRAVRAAIDALRSDGYGAGLKFGFGGYIASSILEHDALSEDLALATLLVLLAVAIAIALYNGTWRSIPAIGVPLVAASLTTFGIAYLAVGHLNSNTAFLGSIVVGNGINVGLILFARYAEERRAGRAPREAMELAVAGTWKATFTAAFAAGLSYASLMATDFRGFNQFGLIGAVGMTLCWVFAYVMTPPLVLAWEARRPLVAPGTPEPRRRFMELVAPLVHHRPRAVLGVTAVVAVLSLAAIARFARDPVEMDFSKLSDARGKAPHGPAWWDVRVVSLFGEHLTPNVFACRDESEAREVARAIEAWKRAHPDTLVGSVTSVDRLLPDRQAEKLAVLAEIRALATPGVVRLMPEEHREMIASLVPPADLATFTAAELPTRLRARLTETDGTFGTMVLVYPNAKADPWNGRSVLAFEAELRAIQLPRAGIPLASPMLLIADMLRTIGRDGPRATWLSLALVVALVLASFGVGRTRGDSAKVLAALGLGVLVFGGLAGALDLKLNMLNFIALPITFGIGVDYATNIFQRRRLEPGRSIAEALRATGGAVALCSLTTIVGYSSLLVARNQALNSFGLLADLGELACLAAALLALPAWLRLREVPADKPVPVARLDSAHNAGT